MLRALFDPAHTHRQDHAVTPGGGDRLGIASDGILAGTLLATATGWAPAETLVPGDRVVTFDHGLQPLRTVRLARLITPDPGALPLGAHPLALPPGALGNRRALTLLPGQAVLIESDAAETRFGDPFAVIPASALTGHRGIDRAAPPMTCDVVRLDCEGDEILYAEGMTLLHCPRRSPALVASPEALMRTGSDRNYPVLPGAQARRLLAGA